ncbi:MAG: hypothetical protein HZB82_00005 [Deltaproteobacteria bacterium]|nr:hypothetical protein [Deltaproteobacteria bacterium]
MNKLSGREKFEQCRHKGYRTCPQYANSIMKEAIIEIREGRGPTYSYSQLLKAEEEAAKLCESCDAFRTFP